MTFLNVEKMKADATPVVEGAEASVAPAEAPPQNEPAPESAPAQAAAPEASSPAPEPAQQAAAPEQVSAGTPASPEQGPQAPAPASEAPTQSAPTSSSEAEMEAKFREKMLKELNLDRWEDLQQRVNPPAAETPEQTKRREDIKRAAVQEYAVRNLEMSPEDFTKMEQVRSMSDEDLVYSAWESEWIKENKDNAEFEGKDLKTEARYEFEEMFHLNSDNARIRRQAEVTIAKTAKSIRDNMDGAYKLAEEGYDSSVGYHDNLARFKTAVKASLSVLPTERTFNINDTEKVTYSLDKVDKVKLEQFLVNSANFEFFMQKGGQEATNFLNERVNEYIVLNHHDDMVQAAITTARAVGLKEGAVGAKAPFVETSVQQQAGNVAEDLTPEDRKALRNALNTFRAR